MKQQFMKVFSVEEIIDAYYGACRSYFNATLTEISTWLDHGVEAHQTLSTYDLSTTHDHNYDLTLWILHKLATVYKSFFNS